jgi:hypothetical protein
MTKSRKRRTREAESLAGRSARMTKSRKKRTREAEPEGPEGGPTVDRVSVHHELHSRRTHGGASPTPEAYAHAAEQWQQLPGAIISRTQVSPTPIRPNGSVAKMPAVDKEKEQQQS